MNWIKRACLFTTLWLLISLPARAVLTIEITQGADDAMPIAVVPFAWGGEGEAPEQIDGIVAADLQRSGFFRPLDKSDLIARPHQASQVNYTDWRALKVNHLVVGKVLPREDGSYTVQFQLLDVNRRQQLAGYSMRTGETGLRRTAHQISDIIYQKITGKRGAFDTFIAYITVTGDRTDKPTYQLAIADSDGHNEQIVYQSRQPVLSPGWSPDGKQLVFVSFARGRSEIYIQNIVSGENRRLAAFNGLNSSPAWSPDGKYLAMTLSRDGNPEIYVMHIESRSLQRITRNRAIDTEPAWLPDGKGLVFTSDRGGSPQLYEVMLNNEMRPTNRPGRLTFQGRYNARASVAPDGRHIAMVHREEGNFRIGVLDRDSGLFRVLTDSRLDESPSFAPNGSMIIYATEANYRGILAAVSVDGRAQQRLSLQQGDVREPAWSPMRPE
ncbi:Tol-Pal system beta propeller repeat protein TolB [Thiohalophilus sp.]|uniref:Tol-Pal system beta propeller repeat protein TolB n=1 Tax=Thiohalophilus sp. TaxID=3028392 RepID=UPI002ACE7A9E|nr:Tol-Pal system beta propeller repeat protein TolB [Thiohalophilus sp.]MDZ7663454.1 Tol-Pal system beta propeller repeat protein TolB [Thiohalophilus sp.]